MYASTAILYKNKIKYVYHCPAATAVVLLSRSCVTEPNDLRKFVRTDSRDGYVQKILKSKKKMIFKPDVSSNNGKRPSYVYA